jgi:TetR/AcrR family transcriptional regulator, transcriptional repressor for nem operon
MNRRTRVKDASHRKILRAASRMVRSAGLSSTSVHEVMRRSGLTVGGFYSHYRSRGQLIRDAFAQAVGERREYVRRLLAGHPKGEWLPVFLDNYLCERHADQTADGCAWAALLSELPRADLATRRQAESLFMGSVEFFADPEHPPSRGRKSQRRAAGGALSAREAALSSLALAFAHLDLARMAVDPAVRREILAAGRKAAAVIAAAGGIRAGGIRAGGLA